MASQFAFGSTVLRSGTLMETLILMPMDTASMSEFDSMSLTKSSALLWFHQTGNPLMSVPWITMSVSSNASVNSAFKVASRLSPTTRLLEIIAEPTSRPTTISAVLRFLRRRLRSAMVPMILWRGSSSKRRVE